MKVRYKSLLKEAIHGLAADVHAVGKLDQKDMEKYDRMCLVPPIVAPDQIKRLRHREALSQADFAHHLNVTPGLVSQWERGTKKPSGPSLKLLDLVSRKGVEVLL